MQQVGQECGLAGPGFAHAGLIGLSPYQGRLLLARLHPLSDLVKAWALRQVRAQNAGNRPFAGEDGSAGRELKSQCERVVLHQQAKTGVVGRLVWCAGTEVQCPFHRRDIGQVGLSHQLFAGADKFWQFIAPLREVSLLGWVGVPKGACQPRQALSTNELGHYRKGGLQHPLGQQVAVGLIGL